MAALRTSTVAALRTVRDGGTSYDLLWFWCPGCDEAHAVPVTGPKAWTFDGNLDAPTLSPSLLCRRGGDSVCHSFVRAGRMQFLGDCTHALPRATGTITARWCGCSGACYACGSAPRG